MGDRPGITVGDLLRRDDPCGGEPGGDRPGQPGDDRDRVGLRLLDHRLEVAAFRIIPPDMPDPAA